MTAMRIRIICTLGPASARSDSHHGLDERGSTCSGSTCRTPPRRGRTDHRLHPPLLGGAHQPRHRGRPGSLRPVDTDLVLATGAEIDLVAERVRGRPSGSRSHRTTSSRPSTGSSLHVDFHGAVLRVLEVVPTARAWPSSSEAVDRLQQGARRSIPPRSAGVVREGHRRHRHRPSHGYRRLRASCSPPRRRRAARPASSSLPLRT